MAFYIVVIVLGILYLALLCWKTRFNSESYIRYTRVCESGLLKMICSEHQAHFHVSHALFLIFLLGFYWCVYKLCLLLGWQMWEMYVFVLFNLVGSYFYFLKKQLLLVVAEKYVLHL